MEYAWFLSFPDDHREGNSPSDGLQNLTSPSDGLQNLTTKEKHLLYTYFPCNCYLKEKTLAEHSPYP